MKTATTVQEFNFELPTGEITVQAEFKLTKAHRDRETGESWDEECEIQSFLYYKDGSIVSNSKVDAICLELELPATCTNLTLNVQKHTLFTVFGKYFGVCVFCQNG